MTPKWQSHPIPSELIKGSGPPAAGTVIAGYPHQGPGDWSVAGDLHRESRYWHIYTSTYLDRYVEVSDAEIVEMYESATDGPSLVRVKPDATLRYVEVFAAGTSSPYLHGGVTRQYLAGAPVESGDPPSTRKTSQCTCYAYQGC